MTGWVQGAQVTVLAASWLSVKWHIPMLTLSASYAHLSLGVHAHTNSFLCPPLSHWESMLTLMSLAAHTAYNSGFREV